MFVDICGYRGDGEKYSPVTGIGDGEQIWGRGGEWGSIL
ncbi:hypothetical protein A2U01_0041352, partial [Trifolium medium]|nr:hypothetical protein [Trifolium medium]